MVVCGWVGQIKTIDHLSPAEAETKTELGKNEAREKVDTRQKINLRKKNIRRSDDQSKIISGSSSSFLEKRLRKLTSFFYVYVLIDDGKQRCIFNLILVGFM